MNTPSNTAPESPNQSQGTAAMPPTRPFYWSVWRELWENHSIYIAPSIVSAIILFGSFVGSFHLPGRRQNALLLDPARRRAAIELPYDIVAVMLIFTAFIIGVFYCLDALHGERRERSILFWKSLPVSDLTTVLSKVSVSLVVLPLVSFAVIVATQFMMLLISTAALLPSGLAATTWANFNLLQQSLVLLYGLIAIALWHAPIYGWALLVSGWVRRATFLWAVLPLLGIAFFEKITFNTSHFASMLKDRLLGFAPEAFEFSAHAIPRLTPGRYLSSPGLWLGLVFAAAFIIAAVRLRRYRGPL
ncbi:MAG: ABC transporter permease [Verrucomicrobia bacterium]|nr:MAG: ABC transporter permease [Verrucomicrobiota bacterium]